MRGEFEFRFQASEELQNFFGLLGIVAFVGLSQQLAVLRDEHVFAGRAANVDSASFAWAG